MLDFIPDHYFLFVFGLILLIKRHGKARLKVTALMIHGELFLGGI